MNFFKNNTIIIFLLFSSIVIAKDGQTGKNLSPIEVFVKEVVTEEIYDSLVFGGFIEPDTSYDIGSETVGNLKKLNFKLAQKVKKGDTLFEILPASAGFEYQLNRVKSPVSGIITDIEKKIGDWITQGDIIVSVTDNSNLKTTIHVTYEDLPYLTTDVPIAVTVGNETNKGRTLPATIESISPKADITTGTYPVELSLNCASLADKKCSDIFRIGALLKVVIKKNFRKGIKIPLLHLHEQRTKILSVSKDNKAKWIKIKLGNYYGEYVEVIEGLTHGMLLVSGYAKKPKNNDPLKIVEDKTLKKAQ